MFTNIIYLILAILIFAVYQPPEAPILGLPEALGGTAVLLAGFALFVRRAFARIDLGPTYAGDYASDQQFSRIMARQSVTALAVYAVLIHGLGLPAYLAPLGPFKTLPTLLALVFLAVFIGLLALVWQAAHPAYRRLYDPDSTRANYVLSNVRMSVPVILPWLAISIGADLIFALPYEAPRRFLSSIEGQMAYFLSFLVAVAVLAPMVIQRFWGCRPLAPGPFRRRIHELCLKAGVQYRDILSWPIFGGRMLTAGVMGLVRRFRYILVTDALLRSLDPEEFDAVIAHEIGHVKKHHLLYYIVFMAGFMLLTFAVNNLILFAILYAQPLYRFVLQLGLAQSTAASLLFSLVFCAAFLIYFRYLFGYFMRNFERQADVYVYAMFGTAQPMIRTFHKIAVQSGQDPAKPNWHHFSIRERIAYLLRCEQDRRWITRQDRKVRRSLALYALGLVLVGVIGYQINYGAAGRRIGGHFLEEIVQREIQNDPHNASLYALLGDLRFSQNAFAETVQAYETALQLAPDTPQVLNNLAWLYATCEDPAFRNPPRALALAQHAATLEPEAYVLDTLAESYFANGDRAAALTAARQALAKATDRRDYYRQQLERFENGPMEENN
jgi:Zn-dependent protease with chaperone function